MSHDKPRMTVPAPVIRDEIAASIIMAKMSSTKSAYRVMKMLSNLPVAESTSFMELANESRSSWMSVT